MAKAEKAAPAKGGGAKMLILLIVFGLLAAGAGFTMPMLLGGGAHKAERAEPEAKGGGAAKLAFVPFGDVVVNIQDERLGRFLRVKLILVVDEKDEKAFTELVGRKKVILKNWLISYLCDRTLEEVKGAGAVNRLRREIQEQFNNLLFSDGSEKIKDVLFEEFLVQ